MEELSFIVIIIAIIIAIVAIYINYLIIMGAVEEGTKKALKQSEYYLEIIAKGYKQEQQKEREIEKERDNKNMLENENLMFMK